jgi:hypothetical protein
LNDRKYNDQTRKTNKGQACNDPQNTTQKRALEW